MAEVNHCCIKCDAEGAFRKHGVCCRRRELGPAGGGGGGQRRDRRRQTARADVSASRASCPTCIFKEQLCFLPPPPLLLLLLHANYRERDGDSQEAHTLLAYERQ